MDTNSLITDSVAKGNLASLGLGPSMAMNMTYVMMADSIGLVMQNAASYQHNTQQIAQSALTCSCAMILAQGGAS